MSTEERPEPGAAPGRIALRSPLEAFLWIFITRLIALLTTTRLPAPELADDAPSIDATAGDPDRARRVAASRPRTAADRTAANGASTSRSSRSAPPDSTARTVAVTAAATVVAGAAAFTAGRRRGRR